MQSGIDREGEGMVGKLAPPTLNDSRHVEKMRLTLTLRLMLSAI